MKRAILILNIAFLTGLLISSQGLAAGQKKMIGSEQYQATQSGIQTQDQQQTQDQLQTRDQVRTRELKQVQITEMQRLLNEQGYQVGAINGILDEETMAAIRLFQNAENLTLTGMPNPETLRALAPAAEQQEFFGVAPEFGETDK